MEKLRNNIKARISDDITYNLTEYIMKKIVRSSFEYFVAAKTKEQQGEHKDLNHIDEDLEEYYWEEFRKVWVDRNGVYPEL